jgi:hypothetical protein
MGLDLWFREDVVRILASTQETMRKSMAASPPLRVAAADSYREGFDDALYSVAVAFGICAPTVLASGGQRPAQAVEVDAERLPHAEGFSTRVWSSNGSERGSHDRNARA